MYVLLTGRPGVGKTTVFMRVMEELKAKGLSIVGFYCPEVREGGSRLGFKIVDINSGEWRWLALRRDRAYAMGKKVVSFVGRYAVLDEAIEIGVKALENVGGADILAIDELGPMELALPPLKRAIERAVETVARGILVVHRRFSEESIWRALKRHGYRLFQVTLDNRDSLPSIAASLLLQTL